MYRLEHGAECTVFIAVIRDPDVVRRPAARPFVQDAQSAVRLPVSPSRRSRDRLSGSRTALWTSRTNRLAAGRRTASALGLDDVELLSAKQIRLTGKLFCEWHACRYQ